MQDVYVETEALTLPLRFAMVASRVASVLKGIQQGRPLDKRGRESLHTVSKLLDNAAQGGTVLRNRSMAGYSAEAMSAYRLVQETKLPGVEAGDPSALVPRLKQIAEGLRKLAEDKPTDLSLENLQQFFTFLTKRSLEESAGQADEVVRIG